MTQYLVAIHHPDGYDGFLEGEGMVRDIGVLNEEMDAAGVRVFAGGLTAAGSARSLRRQPDGEVLVGDGKSHIEIVRLGKRMYAARAAQASEQNFRDGFLRELKRCEKRPNGKRVSIGGY
jgi:hypothetical protein